MTNIFSPLESDVNDIGIPWVVHDRIIELISNIQFKCEFNNNTCIHYRCMEYVNDGNSKCCCDECRYNRGFLNAIRLGGSEYYCSLFDSKTGFYRENVGCILPLSKRSTYCACFYCKTIEKTLTPQQKSILNLMVTERG